VSRGKFPEKDSDWPLYAGVLFAFVVMVLALLGALDAVKIWIRILIYLAAFILCHGAVFLIGKASLTKAVLQDEATIAAKSACLGTFDLNGHSFAAYEKETGYGGRQFRLLSYPSVDPEQEAAIIRYMVREGLIEGDVAAIKPENRRRS
jgi:hypothetical protein